MKAMVTLAGHVNGRVDYSRRSRRRHTLIMASLTPLYPIRFVAIRVGLAYAPPLAFAALRVLLAGIALLAVT